MHFVTAESDKFSANMICVSLQFNTMSASPDLFELDYLLAICEAYSQLSP